MVNERTIALVSVSDKTGVAEFAASLVELGYEIVSTGGTAKLLKESGVAVTGISDLTGYPEILNGRVKTLHPVVHGAILARDDQLGDIEALNIAPIGLVCCNLYPFYGALEKGLAESDMLEEIDIGGVTLLRAAAKNFAKVIVASDNGQYNEVIERLRDGNDSYEWRRELAAAAFAHTAQYDTAIAGYFTGPGIGTADLPDVYTLSLKKVDELRYGENPHQRGAVYLPSGKDELPIEQLNGPAASYNNLVDLDAAMALVAEFKEPCAAFFKHASPCGAAIRENLAEATKLAWEADALSAYGGIVAANRSVDMITAEQLMVKGTFLDCIAAPDYDEGVVEYLSTAKKWCNRFKIFKGDYPEVETVIRNALGAILIQDDDIGGVIKADYDVPTERKPTDEELRDLIFAFKVVKYVRSNGIAIAKDGVTIEMGGGAVNRVWPVQQAIERAGERAKGAVLASDGFFPMPDGPEAALKAGITAIIQPGGSKRDEAAVKICDKYGAAMIMAGLRHFRH
ncbi:MAG: bifunctional phosphoribosylaminoimidazolecarboxamide formyltransferase/IMP cyclohydrolase [bacterium]|nr:bifunctional phosphoribosylaminoimidazolecarboxamide formyltransferase/IMP cyclohydrolase [bacterium]